VPAERRAAAAAGWPPTASAVVVVSRGSSDPDANADLFKVSRMLWDHRIVEWVEPAFVSLAAPSVAQALERCRRLGAARIAVVPYFLFPGILVDRIGAQAAQWSAVHPDVEVRTGRELGPDPRLARLVLERYREALDGDVRMNCDCCAYRIALPGYEDRVGRPLAIRPDGHHH
jgi:cobalt/nickel transport system ATP-binding protein